ncbi:hypothetical protein ACJQWK_04746 [Exserohilum turcicum]
MSFTLACVCSVQISVGKCLDPATSHSSDSHDDEQPQSSPPIAAATAVTPIGTWGHQSQVGQTIIPIQSIPATGCPLGCTSRHNGSDKSQIMAIMLQCRVEEVVDPCIRLYQGQLQGQAQTQLLQVLETTLVDGLTEAILSLQTLAFTLLGIRTMCLTGGITWIVWQMTKTLWVLPRLTDAGILACVTENGYSSDMFRDTMPDWLRPIDIQKTFE